MSVIDIQKAFFDFFKTPDINQGVQEYKAIPGAVLLDVRMPQEYREGHIPKSKNVPLQSIEKALSVVKSCNCRRSSRRGNGGSQDPKIK